MTQQSTAIKIPEKASKLTPMMRQYFDIKSQYEDALLFYRLGDFYEMFYDDAKVASKLLDLTLTTRNKNSENPVPLCGVPHHAAEGYIAKLVAKGKKVVICDQVEDPKQAKGIVKRDVTRVVSPGIVMETQSLPARANNFLMCILSNSSWSEKTKKRKNEEMNRKSSLVSSSFASSSFVYAICDVSTGQLEYASLSTIEELIDEMARLGIQEFVYTEKDRDEGNFEKIIKHYPDLYHKTLSDLFVDLDYATDILKSHYHVVGLESLGLDEETSSVKVLGLLLSYLKENKVLTENLLQQPVRQEQKNHMLLDESTVRNLELFKTVRDNSFQGTLLWHLDTCETSMGSRKMAEFLRKPLMCKEKIEERHEAVAEIISQQGLFESLTSSLKGISDIERLANRFVVKSANARDAISLKESFSHLPSLQQTLQQCTSPLLQKLGNEITDFSDLAKKIETTIIEEPPLTLREGGMIRAGVNADLDDLKEIERSGKGYIAKMEATEREKTGISSLKIRYNNVFGYYMEVTHTHKDKVPQDYIRKQTLTNAERYINSELKEYEQKVLGASERIKAIEYDLFSALRDQIQSFCTEIKETATALAVVDVFQSFSKMACQYHYVRPQVTTERILDLKGARHPILERLNIGEQYIPNDLYLEGEQSCELIITGPNMAGKSTVMRMAGLVVILAQIGCFVPCDTALIGICDRVFTRVGAHDYLQKGMSTFMVEMLETARILREATARSLILLDEIGRGTSTFDGLSIAWAVAEDIHDRIKARTLFATHYHQLCDLAEQKKGIKNFQMAVREWNNEIVFLRKLKQGGTNRSYGVVVASMAGVPQSTVKRAKEILKLLELKDLSFQSDLERDNSGQMGLFEEKDSALVNEIKALELDQMTPLDALHFLHEIKDKIC